jgi:predicted  nucleic acid-binding Zn-ribbon protein
MVQKQQQYSHDDMAALEAQIEHPKEAIALLQTQLADMREQRDRWQSRAERVSIVAAC